MTSESRICQSCKSQFIIEPEDFAFYERMKVPPPTWCPECRNIRRLAWREDHTLYKSTCALCKKPIISIYDPSGPFTVYCRPCWNSDRWDPMAYGQEYDFRKPFFVQFRELTEEAPRPALTGSKLVNSEYAHASLNCKNCYLVFWGYAVENVAYAYGPLLTRDSCDIYVTDNSDHAYETLHSNRLYRVRFAYLSDNCLDSAFLYDCSGCSDCFGCINLRKQKYRLFNEQFSKEEYFKRLAYWDLGSYARLQEAKEKFRKFCLSMPHRYAHVINSVNVSGDIIRDTKNCQMCFSALDGVENCKYLYFGGLNLKDSQDVSWGGDTSALLYEVMGLTSGQAIFSVGGSNSKNIAYSTFAYNSSDLFGCAFLKHKRYCILNRQYTPKEYETLVGRIKEHMDEMPYTDTKGRVYRYGEFFPPEFSAIAYNESPAFTWYPKTKEEVLREGWQWKDALERNYQTTKPALDLPDHIRDVDNSILQETIGCPHNGTCNEQCTVAFRLTPMELSFYREMNLALPRLCPNCRHMERLQWRNRFHLWRRRCMCTGGTNDRQPATDHPYQNSAKHFHGDNPCPNEFDTTWSPDRPEIIYCGECYKAEFL